MVMDIPALNVVPGGAANCVPSCRTTRAPLGTSRGAPNFSCNTERGIAALEFALILPLLLLVLGGMVEISLMLYDQAILTNASREGARAGIVLRQPKPSTADIEAVALNYATGALVSLGAASAPVVTIDQVSDPIFATPLRVTVTYDFSGFAAVGVLTALTGPVRLTATAVMNHE